MSYVIRSENLSEMMWEEAPSHIETPVYENDIAIRLTGDFLRRSVNDAFPAGENDKLRKIALETCQDTEVISLMHGTLNLVNTIIEEAQNKEPYKTLVFLDKSARNAAYMFSEMWDQLEHMHRIPQNLEKPNIRFMNIGTTDREKHTQEAPLALLKRTFRQSDFEKGGNTLVVDEWIASGASALEAKKVIETVFETNVVAMSMFDSLPAWYGKKEKVDLGILGVDDREFWDENEKNLTAELGTMSGEDILKIADIVGRVGRKDFHDVYEVLYNLKKQEASIKENTLLIKNVTDVQFSDEEVEALEHLMALQHINFLSSFAVCDYIESAGGFLAVPIEGNEKRSNFTAYRQLLKTMVTAYNVSSTIGKSKNTDSTSV